MEKLGSILKGVFSVLIGLWVVTKVALMILPGPGTTAERIADRVEASVKGEREPVGGWYLQALFSEYDAYGVERTGKFRSEVLAEGNGYWNGRELPGAFVKYEFEILSRQLGERIWRCGYLAILEDQEFEMGRHAAEGSCEHIETELQQWTDKVALSQS